MRHQRTLDLILVYSQIEKYVLDFSHSGPIRFAVWYMVNFLLPSFPISPTFSAKSKAFLQKIRTTYDCGEKPPKTSKGEEIMKSNNQINVPQAREAMDKFKMQAANEEDVSSTS